MLCPACGGEISADSRFCPLCGAATTRKRGRAAPWILAGAAVAAISAALLVRLTAPPPTAPAGDPASAAAVPPDISGMTPRQAADRLFNRIMSAAERGDTAQVAFFRPMALEAYGLLGTLDPDARYHMGVISFVSADWGAAAAQVDTILAKDKDHLLALALRAQIAHVRKDVAGRDRWFRAFLSAWDPEMKSGRAEYREHAAILNWTRQEATAAVSRKKPA